MASVLCVKRGGGEGGLLVAIETRTMILRRADADIFFAHVREGYIFYWGGILGQPRLAECGVRAYVSEARFDQSFG